MSGTRRELLQGGVLAGGLLLLSSDIASAQTAPADDLRKNPPLSDGAAADGPYTLPALPYSLADLEPHLDAETLSLHHAAHHAAHVRGANAAVIELERMRRRGASDYQRVRALTADLSHHLAGHALHSIYWRNMRRDGGGDPAGGSGIGDLLRRDFGAVDKWREHMAWAASEVPGGGWAILGYEPLAQRLLIVQAHNHENSGPAGIIPLLAIDVWEHAYYLRYKDKRASYLRAFMNLIHWDDVDARLRSAMRA